MPTTTTFHNPADTLDAVKAALAADYDHTTVCASIEVRPDWGRFTTVAYEGNAISKAPNGALYLWFWRSYCDEHSDGPAPQVYSVHSLSTDTEESFRGLLSTIGRPPHEWAVKTPTDVGWTLGPINRIIRHRFQAE